MLLFPVVMRSKQLPKAEMFDQDPNTRHKTWKQRWSTLETFTNQLAECQPDRAFCLYVQSGKDLQTLIKSSPQLQGIFQHRGWQHVHGRLRQAELLAPIASTTSQATASTSTKQHAIISGQVSASHHASMPKRRKRRKVIKALYCRR